VAAVYRKIHLFDCDVPGAEFRDSATFTPGTEVVAYDGPDGLVVGCSLCYDVRFPELYRALVDRSARIVAVPAAFTAITGPPHWELLVRARAVENQVYVVAAGQTNAPGAPAAWHGHSMIVDPWGTVLAQLDAGQAEAGAPGVIVADVDVSAQDQMRARLPALHHRRLPG
jgi:predicted amidohydrolase